MILGLKKRNFSSFCVVFHKLDCKIDGVKEPDPVNLVNIQPKFLPYFFLRPN